MANEESESLNSVLDRLEQMTGQTQNAPPASTDYESPTLAVLEKGRRPNPAPVCATCPHSMWFASAAHLKCYCREMHVVTWNSEEPLPIATCDGILLSSE